jgi:hypothetical protein
MSKHRIPREVLKFAQFSANQSKRPQAVTKDGIQYNIVDILLVQDMHVCIIVEPEKASYPKITGQED